MKIAIILLALCSFSLAAEQLQFVAEDLPPYHFKDKHGQTKGALVDIVNAVAKLAQVDYTIELYPFARAFRLLKAKPNVLMFSLLKSPSREPNFIWLGKIFHNSAYLVSSTESTYQLANLSDAKQYSVGTIRGYFSEGYLRKSGFNEGENLSLSVKYQDLWQMLFNGRIDFVLTNTLSLNNELNKLGYKTGDVKQVLELIDFPSELHLAANLSLTPTTAKALEQALKTVIASGEYQRILTQWGLR
ncbi:amino acid ABC transporter substrate-binding protein [Thalassotalea sp. M1531]|uniref:Amino acid ABC transporter substrate-binding protein n=1 Tax=Thalassotalea algicola TaxID=2716224 RepID=A0A7Y0LEM8_9GAMM|nr:transporter substrate-binding domain-containing protein [Thalassotalea algicola]NMP32789.1 amino acid ABC transporter substrate-binding protein [Thalassotalea algicola]